GHVWYAPWNGKKGIHIRFASMELLREAYNYCLRNTNGRLINFCMQRGKPSYGGVLPSEHPGKITIRHAFALSESDARNTIRTALINLFKPNPELYYDSNRFFERWIDVRSTSRATFDDRQTGKKYKEFTVYVYLTKK